MYHSTITGLFYNVDFTGTTEYPDSIILTPNVVFECSQLVIQMTINQQYESSNYAEIPYVISTSLIDGSFRIGIRRDNGSNGILLINGLKSSVNINIKIFGYTPPQP
jgi:hypothetical protein